MYNSVYHLRTKVRIYRILQIVRGEKVSRMDKVFQIRWKTFAVRSTLSKMCSRAYAVSLIKRICLIIPNNYMYRLTCCFLSLADIARQCGCKIVSNWKSHNVA